MPEEKPRVSSTETCFTREEVHKRLREVPEIFSITQMVVSRMRKECGPRHARALTEVVFRRMDITNRARFVFYVMATVMLNTDLRVKGIAKAIEVHAKDECKHQLTGCSPTCVAEYMGLGLAVAAFDENAFRTMLNNTCFALLDEEELVPSISDEEVEDLVINYQTLFNRDETSISS